MKYRVQVAKKMEFLHAAMRQFISGARLSLEGNLSQCVFGPELLHGRNETDVLRRNTVSPPQDFVVLKLESSTVEPIFRQMMQAGLRAGILHVQIESDGKLELGAYDSLHDGNVVVDGAISEATLDRWKTESLIREYERAEHAV